MAMPLLRSRGLCLLLLLLPGLFAAYHYLAAGFSSVQGSQPLPQRLAAPPPLLRATATRGGSSAPRGHSSSYEEGRSQQDLPGGISVGSSSPEFDSTSSADGPGFLGLSSVLLAALGLGALAQRGRKSKVVSSATQRSSRKLVALRSGGDSAVSERSPPVIEQAPADLKDWRRRTASQVAADGGKWPKPENDLLLRAARGETVDRPPKWMMRQAGRYLPEYKEILGKSDFFTVCQTPSLAAEVTLQPYWRYPSLDSLIVYSDILVVPVAMGMPCRMVEGSGPTFDFAISRPEDLEKLDFSPNVEEKLGYVFDAIFWTRQRVNNEIPVIGFSGAPWTLMCYMVEGGSVGKCETARKWLYLHPEASRRLLRGLREVIVDYLVGQFDAGASLLQVFDTNAGDLPPDVFKEFCVPDLKYIAEEVKRRRPKALLTIFNKDGDLAPFDESEYDVVGVSWTTSATSARQQCPSKTLQGNLDPFRLYDDPDAIKSAVHRMVDEFGTQKYIANLGHGMMPTHPVEGPKAFVDAIDASEPKFSGWVRETLNIAR